MNSVGFTGMGGKLAIQIAIILLLVLCSYGMSMAVDIPSSSRSRAAIAKITPALKKEVVSKGFVWGAAVYIEIYKEESELLVWLEDGDGKQFRLFKKYKICYFSGDLGPKLKEGDKQAPEGFYQVRPAQLNPNSRFYLSFNLGYPNGYDRAHDRSGSFLMVHGNCVSIGCYAMAKRFLPIGSDRNEPIEEIWTLFDAAFLAGHKAIKVHAFPFRMSDKNMERHKGSKWIDFWKNLKAGYDIFEKEKRPPVVSVRKKKYQFDTPTS